LTVSNITSTSADILWIDTNDNELGYNTYTSEDGGATWQSVSTNLPENTTSDNISGLTNGKEYLVRVEVFDDTDEFNDAVDFQGTLEVTGTQTVLYTKRIKT